AAALASRRADSGNAARGGNQAGGANVILGSRGDEMIARVVVTLKPGVLDPAGKAVQDGLQSLGYAEVQQVRLGKYLGVALEESDRSAGAGRGEEMCRKLLANTVVETFRVELE